MKREYPISLYRRSRVSTCNERWEEDWRHDYIKEISRKIIINVRAWPWYAYAYCIVVGVSERESENIKRLVCSKTRQPTAALRRKLSTNAIYNFHPCNNFGVGRNDNRGMRRREIFYENISRRNVSYSKRQQWWCIARIYRKVCDGRREYVQRYLLMAGWHLVMGKNGINQAFGAFHH